MGTFIYVLPSTATRTAPPLPLSDPPLSEENVPRDKPTVGAADTDTELELVEAAVLAVLTAV